MIAAEDCEAEIRLVNRCLAGEELGWALLDRVYHAHIERSARRLLDRFGVHDPNTRPSSSLTKSSEGRTMMPIRQRITPALPILIFLSPTSSQLYWATFSTHCLWVGNFQPARCPSLRGNSFTSRSMLVSGCWCCARFWSRRLALISLRGFRSQPSRACQRSCRSFRASSLWRLTQSACCLSAFIFMTRTRLANYSPGKMPLMPFATASICWEKSGGRRALS